MKSGLLARICSSSFGLRVKRATFHWLRRVLDQVLVFSSSCVLRNRIISFFFSRAHYQKQYRIALALAFIGVWDKMWKPDFLSINSLQEIFILASMWGVCRLRDRARVLLYLRYLLLQAWIRGLLEYGFLDFGEPLLSDIVSTFYGLPPAPFLDEEPLPNPSVSNSTFPSWNDVSSPNVTLCQSPQVFLMDELPIPSPYLKPLVLLKTSLVSYYPLRVSLLAWIHWAWEGFKYYVF